MEEFIKMLIKSEFCREYSPFIIIAIVVGLAFLLRLKFHRTPIDLLIKILGMVIGVLILYGIVWYMNQITIINN